MLESNLALNNFDFKCYIEFFCQTTNWTKKKGGENGSCLAKSLMELGLISKLILFFERFSVFQNYKKPNSSLYAKHFQPKKLNFPPVVTVTVNF